MSKKAFDKIGGGLKGALDWTRGYNTAKAESAAEIERLRTIIKALLPVAEEGYAEYPTQENGDAVRAAYEVVGQSGKPGT